MLHPIAHSVSTCNPTPTASVVSRKFSPDSGFSMRPMDPLCCGKPHALADNTDNRSNRNISSMKATDYVEREVGVNGRELDGAYWYVQEHDTSQWSTLELKRLRRKIDCWIVPIMFCCYTMQFVDKVLLNVGSCASHRAIAKSTNHQHSMPPSWV